MLNPDDKIIIGVSGGKDSLALLYNLYKVQEKNYHSRPIVALTIDEGIDGYRENSIKKASKFCKQYGIEHKIISFKDKIGKTLDEINELKEGNASFRYVCNYCAVIRRRLINEGAKQLGGNVVALGHNLTDMAETYLMNILFNRFHLIGNQYLFKEGSSDRNSYFLKKITPLMRIPEEEITLYSNIKKIDYYSSHCPFREQDPILRKRVLEFIKDSKKYSPEIEFNLFNGFLKLSQLFHEQANSKKFNICQKCGYPSSNEQQCTFCKYVEQINQ